MLPQQQDIDAVVEVEPWRAIHWRITCNDHASQEEKKTIGQRCTRRTCQRFAPPDNRKGINCIGHQVRQAELALMQGKAITTHQSWTTQVEEKRHTTQIRTNLKKDVTRRGTHKAELVVRKKIEVKRENETKERLYIVLMLAWNLKAMQGEA